jgi:hypothetical protein
MVSATVMTTAPAMALVLVLALALAAGLSQMPPAHRRQ